MRISQAMKHLLLAGAFKRRCVNPVDQRGDTLPVSPWQQRGHLGGPSELHQPAEPLGVLAQVGHVQVELAALHGIHGGLASHHRHKGIQGVLGGGAGGA